MRFCPQLFRAEHSVNARPTGYRMRQACRRTMGLPARREKAWPNRGMLAP
jgi:hypothetical protein